jgi:hypothetical protein
VDDPSLLSAKDGKPLSFVAAVKVVTKTAAYLKALDQRRLDTNKHLQEIRSAYADYRECIEMNARYKT